MRINNKCYKSNICPHKCRSCWLCENHKIKTNILSGGGGVKRCKKCHKYCCYVCTECKICDKHKKKYCCYYLKQKIINYPLDQLFEYCNNHLMLLGINKGEYDDFLSFKFDNKYRKIIGDRSQTGSTSTQYWDYLLYPNINYSNVYALLHLARFEYKKDNVDLYIDWVYIHINFSDDKNFQTVADKLKSDYKINMIKINNNGNTEHHYRAEFDFTYGNKYCQNVQGWINHTSGNSFKPIVLYCFKTGTQKIEFNEFKSNYLNQIRPEDMEKYKFTTELCNGVKVNSDSSFKLNEYRNTVITLATTYIKDILTPNFLLNTEYDK